MRMNLRVNYLIVIIGIIMGLLIGFSHNKFAYTHVGASGGVLSIESAYQQFLPIIYRSGVPEVDTPPCRWPNNPEQNYYIAYKWGDGLQDPQNVWRIAFQEGISTWNGADTPVYYYYNTSTINIIDTYELADETRGRTKITCQKVGEEITTIRIEVKGNTFYDWLEDYTSIQRQGIAAHEAGHGHSVGHIPNSHWDIALLYKYTPLEFFNDVYMPQRADVQLINQVFKE